MRGEKLRLRLHEALDASFTASVHYTLWARWLIHAGCQETNDSEPSYRSALAHSDEATRHKKAFVKMWNPIAREYGLKARTAEQDLEHAFGYVCMASIKPD
ncbi:hypothetical protein [Nonomuraea sp. NPDC049758]|uniref:hypothetical protein n=1 Tax=Nonomuraea sp. NPDC049758 TaxID=3154360 RepID=UPI00341F7521